MAAIRTLIAYDGGPDITERLVAGWAGRLFDVSRDWSDVAVRHTQFAHPDGGAASFGSDHWIGTHVTNSIGTVFLVLANGVDPPVRFDGHALASARCELDPEYVKLAGGEEFAPDFDASNLRGCYAFKNRCWWWEAKGSTLWYGDLYSPGGRLQPFFVGAAAGDSGDIAALGSVSRDGGEGPDDYLVILFRSGTALVYGGSNPNEVEDFGLVGTFFVGEPIGDRPLFQWGANLICITTRGVVPVSAAMDPAGVQQTDHMTDMIRGAWAESVEKFGLSEGWEGVVTPDASLMIVNIPDRTDSNGLGTGRQYVLNLSTGAWCEFRGWNIGAMAVFRGELYYADNDEPRVYRALDSDFTTDHGQRIRILWQTAFSYMPNPSAFGYTSGGENHHKRITSCTAQIHGDESIANRAKFEMAALYDFRDIEEIENEPKRWTRFRVEGGKLVTGRNRIMRCSPQDHRSLAASLILRDVPDEPTGRLRVYNVQVKHTGGKKRR